MYKSSEFEVLLESRDGTRGRGARECYQAGYVAGERWSLRLAEAGEEDLHELGTHDEFGQVRFVRGFLAGATSAAEYGGSAFDGHEAREAAMIAWRSYQRRTSC